MPTTIAEPVDNPATGIWQALAGLSIGGLKARAMASVVGAIFSPSRFLTLALISKEVKSLALKLPKYQNTKVKNGQFDVFLKVCLLDLYL